MQRRKLAASVDVFIKVRHLSESNYVHPHWRMQGDELLLLHKLLFPQTVFLERDQASFGSSGLLSVP